MPPQLKLLHVSHYRPQDVRTRLVAGTRREVPEVEAAVEAAWQATLARPGVHLFDGPVCRFESLRTYASGRLLVRLSRTSYRVLVGTNFCHPEFDDLYGRDVMANAVGVSTGLLTADGFWVMGRRNHSVAYYPGRVHPFAGSIELADRIDLFANAERELREELGLLPPEITGTRLVGFVEDNLLRHPEAIFSARTTRTRDAVVAGLDAAEHDGSWSVPGTPDAVAAALHDAELTPVAKAALLLGGRHAFGGVWFERHKPTVT